MNETGWSIRGNRRKSSVDDGEYGDEDNAMARRRKHHRPAIVLMVEEDPQVLTRVDMEVALLSKIDKSAQNGVMLHSREYWEDLTLRKLVSLGCLSTKSLELRNSVCRIRKARTLGKHLGKVQPWR